jgi:protein gp37
MAESTAISWTDHTFNPWRGCTKVSPGCANCYAACNIGVKMHGVKWGPRGERIVKSESGWREPLAWNRAAQKAGRRARVFCASLADVFEAADTMPAESAPVVAGARLRLLRLIYDTPHLDWLLLTKRPENIVLALTEAVDATVNNHTVSGLAFSFWLYQWIQGAPPSNVWLGTSVENQEQADKRIPHLLAAPAAVRFLSCEPLLGPVRIMDHLMQGKNPGFCLNCKKTHGFSCCPNFGGVYHPPAAECSGFIRRDFGINWVIVGGESGPKARPMQAVWARSLRDQCAAAGAAFHFKQWGAYVPATGEPGRFIYADPDCYAGPSPNRAFGGRDVHYGDGYCGLHLTAKAAGHLLDGQVHHEFPRAAAAPAIEKGKQPTQVV